MNSTQTASQQQTQEGEIVCTVGRDGIRHTGYYPIWTGKIYQAVRRKRDGVLTWRLIGTFGGSRSGAGPSNKYIAELKSAAQYRWVQGCEQNLRCE